MRNFSHNRRLVSARYYGYNTPAYLRADIFEWQIYRLNALLERKLKLEYVRQRFFYISADLDVSFVD